MGYKWSFKVRQKTGISTVYFFKPCYRFPLVQIWKHLSHMWACEVSIQTKLDGNMKTDAKWHTTVFCAIQRVNICEWNSFRFTKYWWASQHFCPSFLANHRVRLSTVPLHSHTLSPLSYFATVKTHRGGKNFTQAQMNVKGYVYLPPNQKKAIHAPDAVNGFQSEKKNLSPCRHDTLPKRESGRLRRRLRKLWLCCSLGAGEEGAGWRRRSPPRLCLRPGVTV